MAARSRAPAPDAPSLFGNAGAPAPARESPPKPAPRARPKARPAVPKPASAPEAAAPPPAVGETPLERAWGKVVAECPDQRSADEHRAGACYVHVVPMGHPHDVRCVPGEPVQGYDGFYRPVGGFVDLHPTGTPFPTEAELAQGVKPPAPVFPRKSFPYSAAEMTGRGETR